MQKLVGRVMPSMRPVLLLSYVSCQSRRSSTSTTTSTTASSGTCLLCDASFQDWHTHSATVGHRARHIVCSYYVNPERHDTMLKELWRHINLDFNQVDEISAKKDERRRGRLTSSLKYLVQRGTVKRSLIQRWIPRTNDDADAPLSSSSTQACNNAVGSSSVPPPPTSRGESGESSSPMFVDSRFSIFASIGWTFAEREVLERVSRLMPDVDGHSALTVTHHCLSPRQTSSLFYRLKVGDVLPYPVSELRNDERSAMLFSILGELQLASRNRGTNRSVADRGAAEALVLNILGTHLVDSIVSELVHGVLQKVVDEGAPVWREYRQQLRLFQVGRMVTKGAPLSSTESAAPWSLTAQPHGAGEAPPPPPPVNSDELLSLHRLSAVLTEEITPLHVDASVTDFTRASMVDLLVAVDDCGNGGGKAASAAGSASSGGGSGRFNIVAATTPTTITVGGGAGGGSGGGTKAGTLAGCLPKLMPLSNKKR